MKNIAKQSPLKDMACYLTDKFSQAALKYTIFDAEKHAKQIFK